MTQPVDVSSGDLTQLSVTEQARLLEEVRLSRSMVTHHQPFARTPHIPAFSGDATKGFDYGYWKGLVQSLKTSYNDDSIIQAIRKSATGQPAQIIGTLSISCTLSDIFDALDTAYDLVLDEPSAWQKFYNARQLPKESVVDWHTRLTGIWSRIPAHGPSNLTIKKRLWDGLQSEQTKESSRHQYDNDDIKEADFVRYLRRLVDSRSASKATPTSSAIQDSTEVEELMKQVAVLSSQVAALKTSNSPAAPRQNRSKTRGKRHQDGKVEAKSRAEVSHQESTDAPHYEYYSCPQYPEAAAYERCATQPEPYPGPKLHQPRAQYPEPYHHQQYVQPPYYGYPVHGYQPRQPVMQHPYRPNRGHFYKSDPRNQTSQQTRQQKNI